ncbi:MAG: class I SAM-dependent methyltransferase [Candidatus Eisenbacteria bacterium]|nr:class I SAM-dependent methyltransferase [Candidatus Eisenbacteria bacterium]
MRIYERLSEVYDLDWGAFALNFVPLVERLLAERHVNRASVLDLACGTGTLVMELARLGCEATGVDGSPEMIERAREKASGLEGVSFVVADMTEYRSGRRHDAVTCTFDSINYVTSDARLAAMFEGVAAALGKNAFFAFDSNTTVLYETRHHGTFECESGDIGFYQELRYDPVTREALTVFGYPDGNTEVHRQKAYGLKDLEPLLDGAGLKVVEAHGGFEREPYTAGSERLVCVAEPG